MRKIKIAAYRVDSHKKPFGELLTFNIIGTYGEWLRSNNDKYRVVLVEVKSA
jgi:hypothetical protein